MIDQLSDKARNIVWLLIAIGLTSIIGWQLPDQWLIVAANVGKLTLYGYVGYWLDRTLFVGSRVHEVPSEYVHYAWSRRAMVVAGTMIAGALMV